MTETTISSFNDFSLPEALQKSIQALSFTVPTPIQAKAIPLVLDGRDVISLAETGSGKTAAYLIPAIARAVAEPKTQVLVLAPTRELAQQIADVFRTLTVYSRDLTSATLIGGAPMFKQIKSLRRKPRFLVATPGRLMDHVRQRTVDLREISLFILDEADRMFDMGFAPQVNEVVRHLPEARQTLLFSATFAKEVKGLANRILKNPIEVEVRKSSAPPAVITQKTLEVEQHKKDDLTLDLVNAAKGSTLIFARTKHRADRLTRYLLDYGVKVTKIHGDRTQGQRNRSLNDFKSGIARVLVATDIAARGLDVPSVSDVINYDIPTTAEDYIHRIGRTGRSGQKGQALTLLTPHDKADWAYIARKIGLAGYEDWRPQKGAKHGRQSKSKTHFGGKRVRSSGHSQKARRGQNLRRDGAKVF